MIRRKFLLRVEFPKSQDGTPDSSHFAEARVVGHEFRRGAIVAAMLENAHEDAGFVELLNYTLVVARFGAFVLCARHFTGDAIGPFEVLHEIVSVCADVVGRLGQRRTDVDRESKFTAERQAGWREAGGFRRRGAVGLKYGG